jgi:hypothetical protein
MAKESTMKPINQELARDYAEKYIEAIMDVIGSVDCERLERESTSDDDGDRSDEWFEDYEKICDAVAGSDSPHIPEEILPYWEQNDPQLTPFYKNVIAEWFGFDSKMGKKLLIAVETIDREGI